MLLFLHFVARFLFFSARFSFAVRRYRRRAGVPSPATSNNSAKNLAHTKKKIINKETLSQDRRTSWLVFFLMIDCRGTLSNYLFILHVLAYGIRVHRIRFFFDLRPFEEKQRLNQERTRGTFLTNGHAKCVGTNSQKEKKRDRTSNSVAEWQQEDRGQPTARRERANRNRRQKQTKTETNANTVGNGKMSGEPFRAHTQRGISMRDGDDDQISGWRR